MIITIDVTAPDTSRKVTAARAVEAACRILAGRDPSYDAGLLRATGGAA